MATMQELTDSDIFPALNRALPLSLSSGADDDTAARPAYTAREKTKLKVASHRYTNSAQSQVHRSKTRGVDACSHDLAFVRTVTCR